MRWQQKQTCDKWDGYIPLLWSFSSHLYTWIREKMGKSLCSSSAGSTCHTVPTALNRFTTATYTAAFLYRRLNKCRVFLIICSLAVCFVFQLVRMKSSFTWILFFTVTGCSSTLGGGGTPLGIIYSQTGFTEICSTHWQHSGDVLATLATNEHQLFSMGRVPLLCNHHP